MPKILDERTEAALAGYLKDVRSLPNESAKTHRFATLIGELFPNTTATTDFSAGVEKLIRIDTAAGLKRRRIDSYYGNAVIEFENSLKVTGTEAERQLSEYVSGVWANEGRPPRPLIAIASDGLVWRTYHPHLRPGSKGTPKPEDIELDALRELTVSENTLGDFWIWLTSLLFRPERTYPSAEQFSVDFGPESPAFRDAMEVLGKAWVAVRGISEPRLAFDTWQRYLTVTYGSLPKSPTGVEGKEGEERTGRSLSDLETLFLKHTYLANVSHLLIWASISKGKSREALRDVAMEVLSGRFFEARKLANMVENDFFQWVRRPKAEAVLAPIWERIIAQLLTYDLVHLAEDVLKGVYLGLVDPEERHDLGEYYTPDWLCEQIVSELLPGEGWVSVLDPACGSGSFLRAAVSHFLRANPTGSRTARLRAVLSNVVGIDIHPLAVTISRATYVLALGPLLKATRRPIQIPVYMADSLFLPTEVRQLRLGEEPGYEIKFGSQKVILPEGLVHAPDLFDAALAACTSVAADHARSQKESLQTLGTYLVRELPGLSDRPDAEAILAALWQFTEALADLVRTRDNSIWAFIVRNSYRPAMLQHRFDVVIGNPPWLSYRYIADPEYQAEVKARAVSEYAIAPTSQKLFTQMELATVFLAHCLTWFGRDGAQIGFVMPRSVLSADQHSNLRTRSYKAPLRLTAYWDLLEVRPLFNVPACVVFARKDAAVGVSSDALPVKEWEGRLKARDVPWRMANEWLRFERKWGRVIYLGRRTALSTGPGRTKPNVPSPYKRRFRQGATIVPRNFYFVRVVNHQGVPEPDRLYWVETDPEQAKDADRRYKDIRLKGQAEGQFLYATALSRHLLPYLMLPPAVIVLPVERSDHELRVRTAENLRRDGYRSFARWMEEAEALWNERRGEKAGKQTIYERLDYQNELTHQSLSDRHLVLFTASGTNVSAAQLDRESLLFPFVVDHKLYWSSCSTKAEADYLTAFLNSEAVNRAIKPFQSMGLMGERDIHKKVLDLPFPAYKPTLSKHRHLARLGAQARARTAALIPEVELPSSLARRRKIVRDHLDALAQEIDGIVRTLLLESE